MAGDSVHQDKLEFRFVTVVWGGSFVKGFHDVLLPSMLTPGNLPDVAHRVRCRYHIYTTKRDLPVIKRSAAYQRLQNLMPVEIATIEGIDRVGRYHATNECHGHFISSSPNGSALVFVIPDAVWADGACAKLLEIALSGKRMVAILTPRVVKETFVPALLEHYAAAGKLAPIPARELIELSASHLHPELTAAIWNGAHRGSFGSGVYWMAKGGYLARQFHLFPLLAIPEDRTVVPAITVDADYCLAAFPNAADVHVVEDSDELCVVDFTSEASAQPVPAVSSAVDQMVEWAAHHADARNREFLTHVLRYHWSEPPLSWQEPERESNEVVNQVLARLDEAPTVPTVHRPSPTRYISPRFVARKVREEGVLGAARVASFRLNRWAKRQAFGPRLRIEVIPGDGTYPEADR